MYIISFKMSNKLAWMISDLDSFKKPNMKLEQYNTSGELAVSIAEAMSERVDMDAATVVDLGAGCGHLMIATALVCEPLYVLGVELDAAAIEQCNENIDIADVSNVCDIVQADVLRLDSTLRNQFDVAIMNPPFGTKNNAGIDMRFVQAGLSLVRPGGSVFSLHKTSTRDFIMKTGRRWDGITVECVAQMRWDLPATYKFHKKNAVDIDVDLIHFIKN